MLEPQVEKARKDGCCDLASDEKSSFECECGAELKRLLSNDNEVYCQADRGSNPVTNKSFSKLKNCQLTELGEVDVTPRCSWMSALRALTSGRRLYEKCPFCGFEKESVFLTRWGGAGSTSGSGAGSEGVDAGVGVDGASGASPSSNKSGPWPSPLTMSAHERGPRRRGVGVDGAAAPP